MEKKLGKISAATFGPCKDPDYLFGPQFWFNLPGGPVNCGTTYQRNLGEAFELDGVNCETPPMNGQRGAFADEDIKDACTEMMIFLGQLMRDAKVQSFEQLVGKPVEVTLENREFKSFRILTEVL